MTTKHTHKVVFGRKVDGCPRCAELAAGASPVQWTGARLRAEQDRLFRVELAAHDCVASRCGPVCTFGDW